MGGPWEGFKEGSNVIWLPFLRGTLVAVLRVNCWGQVRSKLVHSHRLHQGGGCEKGLDSGARANGTCLQVGCGTWKKDRILGSFQGCEA